MLGGPSNVHLDILRNRDTDIDWDDVFTGTPLISFLKKLSWAFANLPICHHRGKRASQHAGFSHGDGEEAPHELVDLVD
jgi:hypothetical protein